MVIRSLSLLLLVPLALPATVVAADDRLKRQYCNAAAEIAYIATLNADDADPLSVVRRDGYDPEVRRWLEVTGPRIVTETHRDPLAHPSEWYYRHVRHRCLALGSTG